MKSIWRSQGDKGCETAQDVAWYVGREDSSWSPWRTGDQRGTPPTNPPHRPLPTHVNRQSNWSLSTTFPLIRLFFTRAVLIKGLLSTQNICPEVLLWLLMMPRIIKSGRNFQLRFAWSFLPAPCPSSPHSAPISAFTHIPSFLGVLTLLETDLGKLSARINIQGLMS